MISYTTVLNSPDSFDEVIQLIENSFSYNDRYSYAVDFAPLVNSTNWENLHILKDDEKVIAHIGARILNIAEGVPVLLLGGIAVHPEHQSQGHFNNLFEKVLSLYSEKVALMVLWSDLSGLYQKYNFHEAGVILQTGSDAFNDREAEKLGLTKFSLDKVEHQKLKEIQDCFESLLPSFICSKRDGRDWGTISSITSTSLYTHESDGVIDFYALCGKGMDLGGIIHEFSGKTSTDTSDWVKKLSNYKLWIPAKNPWNISKGDSTFYMGIFRIAKPELFSKLIHNWSDSKILISGISNELISFHFLGEDYSRSHAEFLSLLMGPERAEEFLEFARELWITGVDSI